MGENVGDVVCLVAGTRLHDAALCFDGDCFLVEFVEFLGDGSLVFLAVTVQYSGFGNCQMNLVGSQIVYLFPFERSCFDVKIVDELQCGTGSCLGAGYAEILILVAYLNTETAFDVLQVVVKRSAQTCKTIPVYRFENGFQGNHVV